MLLAENLPNIYNMSGGIIAYDGGKAVGDEAFGMEFFVNGDFSDVFRMSYAMEEGLQQLYLMLEGLCEDTAVKALLLRLAKFEESHKARLKALFPHIEKDDETDRDILEGGFDKQKFLDHFQSRLVVEDDVIQLGMMLETQAYDLYSRLSKNAKDPQSKEFFQFMRGEEKQHLVFLSNEYDRILQ